MKNLLATKFCAALYQNGSRHSVSNQTRTIKKLACFFLFMLLTGLSQTVTFANCTVVSSTTFSAFFAANSTCSGTVTIPSGVVLSLSGDYTVPAAINQIIIQNGGQIDWTSNNSTLILAQNTSIIIENTSTTNGTRALGASPCNNTKRIRIGTVEYAACEGGGNVCIIFSNLIAAGGTLSPVATVSVSGGVNGNVCFPTFGINVTVTGFSLGTPTYQWSQTSGPGTSTFSASATTQNPSVTVTAPGTYVYKVEVTDPGIPSCTTVTKVTNSITVEVRPTPTASVGVTGSPVCQNGTSPIVTFTNPSAFPITVSYNVNSGSTQTINVAANSTANAPATPTALPGTFAYNLTSVQYANSPVCGPTTISGLASYTVNPDATISLTSLAGTDGQSLCPNNSAISPITYAIGGGGTSATLTGTLPTGVTGSFSGGVFTISGTPTSQGLYNYTVTTTGTCAQTSLSGSINTDFIPTPETPGEITGPAFACPGSEGLSYSISSVAGATTYTWIVPAGWSIVSGAGTTEITVTAGGDNTGGNVTVVATNGCGSSAESSLPVTSDDVSAPEAPYLPDLTAECSITPTAPVGYDACAGPITGTTTTTFPITAQGTTPVTWTFDDGNGNITTAFQNVVINDIMPPEAPYLPDLTAECSVTPTAPVGYDACAGSITGTTTTTFPITAQGTTPVTWTFDDGNGNITTANQNVVINDIMPPEAPYLPDLTAECSVTPTTPVGYDACAGSITGTTSTVFPITSAGTTVVTWTFDDGNGNTTTADQNVVLTPLILSPITGPTEVNIGSSITLSNTTSGGTWTVDNANATIDQTSGVLDGVVIGPVVATYSFTSAENCNYTVNREVTVKEPTLPVKLVSFTGKKTGVFEASLTWATSEEKEFREFQIQKSPDSKNFETVGTVAASSESRGSLNYYKFTDKNVATSANYYRLKLIDNDGTFEFSKIIHLEGDVIDNDVIGQVYPNPANKEQVSIDVISNKTGSAEMVLYNLAGVALKKQQLQLGTGQNKLMISTDHLANGMYFLKVNINSTSYGRKIVISK